MRSRTPGFKCLSWAKAHPHPERPEQTTWEAFKAERPELVEYRSRFDGFHALPASVSKTWLVRVGQQQVLGER